MNFLRRRSKMPTDTLSCNQQVRIRISGLILTLLSVLQAVQSLFPISFFHTILIIFLKGLLKFRCANSYFSESSSPCHCPAQ